METVLNMCGILGEFGNILTDKSQFLKVNRLSERRGPDMSGYWSNGEYCQMAFNRLSIIDLTESGNQPMVSSDKRWVMVMNGEVYNFLEIREELGCSHSDFNSQTDSEVVLTAFQNWGMDKTLERVNGIFAIALFDSQNKQLHLIRDFAGVKPLYFGSIRGSLIFASQYNQIFEHPLFKKSRIPNPASLYDYTRFGYVPAPNAFFKNTWQVEPGQVVSFDLAMDASKKVYYDYSVRYQNISETDTSTIEKLDSILTSSIKNQLISDVPIGAFLSGGVDSPLITHYAHELKSEIETFTIGSENPNYDETDSAQQFARFLNVANHLHYYSEETLILDIDNHFRAFSEPFGDYSSLPTFQVCQMAKTYFSVILGGDGGDEVFWGYPRFHHISSHLPWFNYGLSTRKIIGGIGRKLGWDISYGIHVKTIGDWVIGRHSANHAQTLNQILPGLSNSEFIQKLYHSPQFSSKTELLNWLRWNEFYGHLQRVLMKVDRTSMHHSLEVRVPFLDRNILDFSKHLQPGLSISHKTPKYLLRKLMQKKYPTLSVNQDKMGFSIDMDNALRTVLKEEVCDLLIGRDPYPQNTFDRTHLQKYVGTYFDEKNGNEWGIWVLYALQKWAQSFGVSN